MAVLVMSSPAAAVGPASAAEPPTQEQPRSTWLVPGTGSLDGLGTFLYVAAPVPGPAQGSPLGYEYTMLMKYDDASYGVMVVGVKDGQKVAGFSLLKSHPRVATVPFDWQFGRFYYLLTYRIAPDVWAAWIYDWNATKWTHIATQEAPGIGRMLPTSDTVVDYQAGLLPTPAADPSNCAFYPRVDAFWYPPTGWRGAAMTRATLSANSEAPGTCPSVTSSFHGWQRSTLGASS